ncbi:MULTISPECIES: hypothetical protein [Acinetobacter]|uniref:hypothetical protein n=1 Tax=Acinetobacter TaxID=469 RepID=UPI00141AE626|nr:MULTISPECIES: hypothetical protein [Acinetobacter]MCS4298901.1 hypothetical protein [Acinetobacter guillouiae]MCW2252361.1 hypothetical protein [Acinetobacter sp. BIGb0204]NII38052.1 hypothetical protein [Acinetobacter sp. BIGb0196]
MSKKDELKELEASIKKIDPNLSIWVMMKFMRKFRNELGNQLKINLNNSSIFQILLTTIHACEKNEDAKSKALLLILDLEINHQTKLRYIHELINEYPTQNLVRILKAINNNTRLSDFIYYNISPIYSNLIEINKKFNLDDLIAREPSKELVFHSNELIQTYSNNTSLLANLVLMSLYFEKENYESTFNLYFKKLEIIKKKSKTIIERNLNKEGFTEWLFSYIEKNIIHGEMTQNTDYTPYTSEEKTNFMLHQLDLWYLLDEEKYDKVLKKVQLAWHKKTHDARKRASKL